MVTCITSSITGTDLVTDGGPDDTAARLAGLGGRNVLVAGGPMVGKGAFVQETLAAGLTAGRDALLVTATRSMRRRSIARSDRFHIVDCTPLEVPESRSVTNVAAPSDLTGMSMPVSKFMSAARPRPVVVVDSLTSLLMYADQASVFRLLSVLTTQIRNADGVGLFTVAEGCHEEQTVRTFAQLFDGQVELRPEGGARTRGLDDLDE